MTSEVKLVGLPPRREPIIVTVFDDFVGVHDDGDEEGEHNIDEEADERVKVDSAVDPHRHGLVYGDTTEGSKHVITIDEREKAFRGGHESLKLEVVGPQDNPTSKGKSDIKEKCADEESEHVRGRSLHGQNEDIVSFEEAKIAKNSKPDQQIPSSKHQTEKNTF